MSRLCFIDTETTSLRPDRRAWEIGIIVRTYVRLEDGSRGWEDAEHHWFVEGDDLDLGNADLMSLKIGRFYERHPAYSDGKHERWGRDADPESWVLENVEAVTRGAHLVGAVVSFDADVLGARMRAHGICPSWHYHLIDVEALAVGYLAAKGIRAALPWHSDGLSEELGIAPPAGDERHTALGDARWAMAIYDAVMAK